MTDHTMRIVCSWLCPKIPNTQINKAIRELMAPLLVLINTDLTP